MTEATVIEVRKDEARSRYELVEDGQVLAVADYQEQDGVVVMPHTVVTPSRRGEGLGEQLVQHALDDLRAAGKRVVPACWFVAEFIEHHPEYADLRA